MGDLGFVVTNVTSWMRWMQMPLGPLPPLQSLGAVRLAEPHGIRPVLLAACAQHAEGWFKEHAFPMINGGLIDPLGLATEAFLIEDQLESIFKVKGLAPNSSQLAAALFDATATLAASFEGLRQ